MRPRWDAYPAPSFFEISKFRNRQQPKLREMDYVTGVCLVVVVFVVEQNATCAVWCVRRACELAPCYEREASALQGLSCTSVRRLLPSVFYRQAAFRRVSQKAKP